MSPDLYVSHDRPQAGKRSIASIWLRVASMRSAASRYTDMLSPVTEGYLKSEPDTESLGYKFLSC